MEGLTFSCILYILKKISTTFSRDYIYAGDHVSKVTTIVTHVSTNFSTSPLTSACTPQTASYTLPLWMLPHSLMLKFFFFKIFSHSFKKILRRKFLIIFFPFFFSLFKSFLMIPKHQEISFFINNFFSFFLIISKSFLSS